MASKTSVTGNRVKIDDYEYEVQPAFEKGFTVHNEMGVKLGYFAIRGRTIETEDYGVPEAHPLALIGKLYRDASGTAEVARATSAMICQIVSFDRVDERDLDKITAHRKWLRSLPGLKTAFFVRDPETGRSRSVRVWATREQMNAAAERKPPAGAEEPAPGRVEVVPLLDDL